MKNFYLIAWTLRMIMAIVILTVSSISIFMGMGDVWICVFCLSLLNVVDLSEKEIR